MPIDMLFLKKHHLNINDYVDNLFLRRGGGGGAKVDKKGFVWLLYNIPRLMLYVCKL
jgi:hypothetical protein